MSDNAAKTEYIFMQFMRGKKLSDVWPELEDSDIISILRQLVQLESRMMSISFPAGGSLYYARDLEKVAGRAAIPLEDVRFCVGPNTRLPMWYGRRTQLDVDRGPCMQFPYFICHTMPFNQPIYYRQKCRSSTRSSSLEGNSLSRTIRTIPSTVPPREKVCLPAPGAVTVGPHRELEPLSPLRTVTCP